jgi:hypothetical protein
MEKTGDFALAPQTMTNVIRSGTSVVGAVEPEGKTNGKAPVQLRLSYTRALRLKYKLG